MLHELLLLPAMMPQMSSGGLYRRGRHVAGGSARRKERSARAAGNAQRQKGSHVYRSNRGSNE